MKHTNTRDLILPIIRNVAAQISPIVNGNLTDDDYFQSFRHITKFIRTLNLKMDEFTIIEGTIRMAAFSKMECFGHDYAINDIEEWLLLNSTKYKSKLGMVN